MSNPDFDSIARRLAASHALKSLGNGDIGGSMFDLPVRVRRGRGAGYVVEVTVEVGSHQAAGMRRSMGQRVVGLPSEVSVDIGGNGPLVRARIADPGSILDPLAVVGAIEAVVHAVSVAADAQPVAAERRQVGVSASNSAAVES